MNPPLACPYTQRYTYTVGSHNLHNHTQHTRTHILLQQVSSGFLSRTYIVLTPQTHTHKQTFKQLIPRAIWGARAQCWLSTAAWKAFWESSPQWALKRQSRCRLSPDTTTHTHTYCICWYLWFTETIHRRNVFYIEKNSTLWQNLMVKTHP